MGESSTIAGLTDEFPMTITMADAFRILHLSAGVGRLVDRRKRKPEERPMSPCSATASGGATSAAGLTFWD